MGTVKKKHHHTPEFYLSSFALGSGKKMKLQVLDIEAYKWIPIHPTNTGTINKFYTPECADLHPNTFEDYYEKVEDLAAPIIKEVITKRKLPIGQDRAKLLCFVAHQHIRGPRTREWMDRSVTEMGRLLAAMTGQNISPSGLEHTKARMIGEGRFSEGIKVNDVEKKTLEQSRKVATNGNYSVSTNEDYLITGAIRAVETIYPLLWQRNWQLIIAPKAAQFITSDHPVTIISSRLGYKGPVGFAMKNTEVCFPLSSEVAMVGRFEGIEAEYEVPAEVVAGINQITFLHAHKYIYCRSQNFQGLNPEIELCGWRELADRFNDAR